MSLVIDLAFIAFFALSVFVGYKRGFIKSVMPIASFVVAFLLALNFTTALSPLICEKYVMPAVKDAAEKNIYEKVPDGTEKDEKNKNDPGIPEFISENIDKFISIFERWGTDRGKLESDADNDDTEKESGGIIQSIADLISKPVAEKISNIIAFVAIFAVSFIVLRLITVLLVLLFKAPVLSTFDKAGGIILGALSGLFFIWLFSAVMSYLLPELLKVAPDIDVSAFNGSILFSFFRDYNFWTLLGK